jgi:DNA polymerase-3 subunit epsilon
MREVIVDTETTGLDPKTGDRIIEIGCVEMVNKLPTGNSFQTYLNPDYPLSEASIRITGLTNQFLADKPRFKDKMDEFLNFLGDSNLVIHNAPFDMKFINAELMRENRPLISMDRVVDTLKIARQKYPGSPASLDALCRRYSISIKERSYHGALLDAELLSLVYVELMGGRQISFAFSSNEINKNEGNEYVRVRANFIERTFPLSDGEIEAHKQFIEKLKNSLWNELLTHDPLSQAS